MSSIFNKIPYPYNSQTITINNYNIAYIDEGGSEKTLLFIHGLGSYIPAWKFNIPSLKEHFRCIAIDLPGFGKSDKKTHPATVDFYTEKIFEFLKNLGIKKTSVVGHSMGGQIAIDFSLKHKEFLDKLVLVSPAGFEEFSDNEIDLLKKIVTPDAIYNNNEVEITLNYKNSFFSFPSKADYLIEDRIKIREDEEFKNYCSAVSESVKGMIEQPINNELKNISVPTLIIFGKNDSLIPNKYLHKTTPEEIAQDGANKIPNSRLILLNECGHFPQIEKEEEFNKSVSEFLLIK